MLSIVRRKRAGKPAFTLIELLVVVAIIALLIAILLPTLEKARQASKRSACLSHIKNIATSSRVYEADDPNGWGIPVHPWQFEQDTGDPTFVGAYEWGGKSGIGRPDFLAGGTNPLNSKYGTRAGFGPTTRPMNAILYKAGFKDNRYPTFDAAGALRDTELDLKLFLCPGDDGPPRGAHCPDWVAHSERSSYDHFGNSYAANIFFIGNSDGSGTMKSNSPYMRSVSRVPVPARTLYYEENIGRWAWSCFTETCDFLDGIDPGPTKSVSGWHAEDWRFTRSFVDAHAEYQYMWVEGTEDQHGYAQHYRIERVFQDNGQQTQMRCIIVRGNGWQKDTLPALPLETYLDNPGGGGNRPSYEDCVTEGSPP